MSQTGSNHETNRVELPFERGQNQTRSNHESNRVESWFEFGRNLGGILERTGSNHETIRVDRVGKSRIIGQTGRVAK